VFKDAVMPKEMFLSPKNLKNSQGHLALTYLQCPSPKHMEQELLALLGHIRSSQIFGGVRVVQAFSFLCNVLSVINPQMFAGTQEGFRKKL
jgi:hypothetical protein